MRESLMPPMTFSFPNRLLGVFVAGYKHKSHYGVTDRRDDWFVRTRVRPCNAMREVYKARLCNNDALRMLTKLLSIYSSMYSYI